MDSWHKLCFLLVVSLTQVLTQDVKPVFIEDVQSQDIGMRIVSGWEARPGQHPWQVNLRMVDQTGAVSSCGGSVIHREWGTTAAHCTALRITLVVRAGVTSLTNPVYIFETNTWYNHPSYNDFLPQIVQPNDFSIIKFNRRLTFGELLQPIRLQTSADAYRNYNEEILMASGHGRTWTLGSSPEVLNWVYLRGVSNANCAGVFGSSLITATTICARYYNVTSQSTCQGDSGGPLVIVENDKPVLIGIASFVAGGDFGCHSGFPAGFCRPGPFLSWMKDITGIDFENLEDSEESSESDETAESSHESHETAESSYESHETAESSHESDETAETHESNETAETHESNETAETHESNETAESLPESHETAESSHESAESGQTTAESGQSSGENEVSEPKSESNEIEYDCRGNCRDNVEVDVRVRVRIGK